MQKVLIISYFFPPCNLTASQRANNWAKELNKFGYFPIVVTRKWDHKIESTSDLGKPSFNQKIDVIINDKCKIIYAPYKSSLKDMIFIKYPYLNIGSGEHISIKKLASLIKKVTKYKGEIYFNKDYPDGVKLRKLDNKKIIKLGWKSKISLKKGLVKYYNYFEKNVFEKN